MLRLLSVHSQDLPGELSSTCLNLIRPKLSVGGGEHEHMDALADSPNRNVPAPESPLAVDSSLRGQLYRYSPVIRRGHNLKYHVGHLVF